MGLNGIRNPAKLRKLSALIGEPAVCGFARYFQNQRTLLVFGESGRTYLANLKEQTVEPYEDDEYTLRLGPDGRGIERTPRMAVTK